MKPREFAEALSRGEKFLDSESGEIISIYGGPDITGDVVGFTDDGKRIDANAKNLELANIKDKSDTEKLNDILDNIGTNNSEKIEEAVEKGNEEYLINHKQEIIENIRNIRLSQLPEKLRGDIDVMTAAIVNGDVYEMQDLGFVYSQATEELRANPEFQMIVKHFETFFEEEARKIYSDKEKANLEALKKNDEAVRNKKSEYTKYYHENYVEDDGILEAIQNGDEEYLIKHKQGIIENIRNIRLSQLPEKLRGDIDVMTAAIVNGNVYEMQDLRFVYSQATEELRANPEFHGVVKEFETFFKEQSKKIEQARETANRQAIKESNERINLEKERYPKLRENHDKASEMFGKGEISYEQWKEIVMNTNAIISTEEIGDVTKNVLTITKRKANDVKNEGIGKENTNDDREGEEVGDDN